MDKEARRRIRYLLISVGIAFQIMALIAIAINMMAPADFAFRIDGSSDTRGGEYSSVLARRLISIPFGIAEALTLESNGQVVQVTGHGNCPAGSESFRLRAQVTQQGVPAPGTGFTEGTCPSGGTITWSADVEAPEAFVFEPGPAQVCGKAVIHRPQGGALTFDWCKDVILQ